MSQVSDKHHAHELIERLPESEIDTAVRFLEFMLLDPVRRALATAPADDEPVTEEDRRRFREGRAQLAGAASMEDVLGDFGMALEDFPADE